METSFSFGSNDVFSPYRGSRAGVTKVLIVITDGESNDNTELASAADFAEKKKIVRFAIGVGLVYMSITVHFAPNIWNKLPETCRSAKKIPQICQSKCTSSTWYNVPNILLLNVSRICSISFQLALKTQPGCAWILQVRSCDSCYQVLCALKVQKQCLQKSSFLSICKPREPRL